VINSKRKGKAGELEFSAFLRERGFAARRGQQFAGGANSPDIMHDLPGNIHIECKRCGSGSLYAWLKQAINDAGVDKTPVVMHRRNNQEWVAILRAADLLTLIGRIAP
jgi:hypothetical protein